MAAQANNSKPPISFKPTIYQDENKDLWIKVDDLHQPILEMPMGDKFEIFYGLLALAARLVPFLIWFQGQTGESQNGRTKQLFERLIDDLGLTESVDPLRFEEWRHSVGNNDESTRKKEE